MEIERTRELKENVLKSGLIVLQRICVLIMTLTKWNFYSFALNTAPAQKFRVLPWQRETKESKESVLQVRKGAEREGQSFNAANVDF